MRRDLAAVRRRIAAGGDCRRVNAKGTSLPHFALEMCNSDLARLMVEAGADPDCRDHRGRTVLWRAVEGKHHQLVEACIASGADLSLGHGTANDGVGDGSLANLALE